jgi:hypothetical protein
MTPRKLAEWALIVVVSAACLALVIISGSGLLWPSLPAR